MMDEMKKEVNNWSSDSQVSEYLLKILRKEAYDHSGLIYGIGHAVYTLSDPRCVLLKRKAKELAKEKGRTAEFDLYERVERLAPIVFNELKKTNKQMCANVDFYSGLYMTCLIFQLICLPHFAIARVVGLCAHIRGENKWRANYSSCIYKCKRKS